MSGQEFRIALHHNGTDADAQRFAAAVEKIVREERAVFGEFPGFEAPYTFITDYLPYASSDGMEHRNSTILTGKCIAGRSGSDARHAQHMPLTSSFTAGMSSVFARDRSSRSSSTRRTRRVSCGLPRVSPAITNGW